MNTANNFGKFQDFFTQDMELQKDYVFTPKEEAIKELYKIIGNLEHLKEFCENNSIVFSTQSIDCVYANIASLLARG